MSAPLLPYYCSDWSATKAGCSDILISHRTWGPSHKHSRKQQGYNRSQVAQGTLEKVESKVIIAKRNIDEQLVKEIWEGKTRSVQAGDQKRTTGRWGESGRKSCTRKNIVDAA